MALDLETKTIDETKLNAVLGRVIGDFGATLTSALMVIGDKLGLYKAMRGAGPLTSQELAARTGTEERYIRIWLVNQAASGYVEYDPQTERYTLPDEQALALADDGGPYFVVGGFELMTSALKAEPRIREAFRTGEGLAWGEHDPGLFEGTERFFRPGYIANLVSTWIPALDGVEEKLKAGATVADIGCGHGASTIIMAQAYPNSRFFGYDTHPASIEEARRAAKEAGVADRVTFAIASAQGYPGSDYDLIAFFDCFHDVGDPEGAARQAFDALAPDGNVMIVEPQAGDQVEDNLNPVGRVFSAVSVLVCTPHAVSEGGRGLGTIATEREIRAAVEAGGFTRFRRAVENPFNRIFEARK